MKTWQKVGIGVGAVVVLGAIVGISVNQANKGVVTVQTAKVGPQDTLISLVTASGEVKPTTYTNVTAQGFGRITSIVVKEGDHIKKGQVLLTQENIQANADVQAQAAAINSAESGVQAGEASYKSAQSDLVQAQANLEHAKLEYERGQNLYKDGLIPKQDFDQRKTTYDAQFAAVDSAKAHVTDIESVAGSDARAVEPEQSGLGAHGRHSAQDDVHVADRRHRQLLAGTHRRLRRAGYSELERQLFDDAVGHVGRDRRSEGGRDRHRERAERPGRRRYDRCDSGKNFQRQSDTDRFASGAAHFGFGDDAIDDEQSGSEGFQGCGDAGASRRTICGRDFRRRRRSRQLERKNVLAIPIQALAVRTRKDLEDAAKDNKKAPVLA